MEALPALSSYCFTIKASAFIEANLSVASISLSTSPCALASFKVASTSFSWAFSLLPYCFTASSSDSAVLLDSSSRSC